MDRRRAEIRTNSAKIKEECTSINEILKRILKKETESVQALEKLSEKQILYNPKRFLSVTKFQHSIMQKITEISIELEAFLCENCLDEEDSKTDIKIDLHVTDTTTQHKEISDLLSISLENLEQINTQPLSSIKQETINDLLSISLGNIYETNIEEPTEIETECKHDLPSLPISVESVKLDMKDDDNHSMSNENEPDEIIDKNNEISDDKSSSSCYPDETDKEVELEKISSDVTSCDENNKSDSCKVAEMKKTSRPIIEILSLNRKDRLLQNVSKAPMPDLSFKPSSKCLDASDNYVSCVESTGSTKSSDSKGKRKKKKKQTFVLQDVKDADFKVAHLSLQDPLEPYLGMLCLISHMVSPAEIYINKADDSIDILDSMTFQIEEFFQNTNSPYMTKEDVKASLGNYCVSYIEDWSSWYRVEVVDWRMNAEINSNLVTVRLVDFGHVTDADFRTLRELMYDFCHIPKCAIKCRLACLYPLGSTKDNILDVWTADSFQILYNIVNKYKNDVYKLTFVEKIGDCWNIELISMHEISEVNSVGQQLIDAGGAVEILHDPTMMFRHDFLISQLKTAQGFNGISEEMSQDEKLDKFCENTLDNEHKNLDEALTGYKANDEARICQFTNKNGKCFKGAKCKLEHSELRKDGFTTDRQYVYSTSINSIALPEAGDILNLVVTSIVNVNTFYCNQIGKSSNYKDLTSMISLMNERRTVEKYKRLKISPALGELVIAKSWQDMWYRAQVVETYQFPNRNQVTIQVLLVDIGETIDVTMSELREMDPVYLHLPFQAILCKLYNVRPKEDQNKEEEKLYCESHFLCQIFKAKVVYASPTYLEVLMSKTCGDDIGEQIIADQHGLLKTESFFPKDVEILLID